MGRASGRIVTEGNPSPIALPQAALRAATIRRMRHVWRGLGRPVQIQIVLGAFGLPALLADHAQRFYVVGTGPRDELIPWIVRVVVALVLLLGLFLMRIARGFFLHAGDGDFLAATPLPSAALFRHRAFQLGLAAMPAVWLGTGAILPLAWNGNAGLLAGGLVLWIAWAVATWAWVAAVAPLVPRPGRGQAALEFALGFVPGLLLWGARPLTGLVVELGRRESLALTAGVGVLVGVALAALAPRSRVLLARWEATLECLRAHANHPARTTARTDPRGPRFGRGAMALVARNVRLALREPRVGGPWAAGILLKAAGFAFVLAPAGPPPWALAGALLLFGDALIAGALIAQLEGENPGAFFGAPLSRSSQWWALAGPAFAITALAALALAGIALGTPGGGLTTARFILTWCGLAGLSLLVTATNLALASYPEVGVAQNLFWVGLLVCLILSAVIPLFGWVVLVAFALYSFRQLRHWGPD